MPIDQPVTLAPVAVQAARWPQAAGDPAYSIIRIHPSTLSKSERIDDALSTTPGFSLFRRTSSLAANPTTQGVSLRGIAGSGASRALVTLDGVPQNDPFGGWVIWTSLPSEAISGARIIRGAGAGPYGAGALTGVIALQQPDHIDDGATGEVASGNDGYRRAAGAIEGDLGSARAFLTASSERDDGWIPVVARRGAADRPLTLADWSVEQRLQFSLGPAVLSERIAGYEEDRGAGTLFASSHVKGVQASLTLVAAPSNSRLDWRLQTWITRSSLANTSASVSPNRTTATLADNQYSTPAIGFGLNAAVRNSTARHSWEFGLDLRDFDGESREYLFSQGALVGNQIAGGGEFIAGVYAEASRSFGRWLLTGGVRLDRWEDYASKLDQTGSSPQDLHPSERAGQVPTGRIGLRRDLPEDYYLRTAAYAGFRPATLNELHRPFRVGNDVTEASAALSPERLSGVEVGAGGSRVAAWDVDIFFNQLANAITNVTIGRGPGLFPLAGFVPAGGTLYERQNVGAVNAYGVEGQAERQLGPQLQASLAFTYTHARVDGASQAPQLTGLVPAETPAIVASSGLTWSLLDRLKLSGELRYESHRFDDDRNAQRIDAATSVNARAEWRVTSAVWAYVAADNLFNAQIQTGRNAANIVTYDAPRMVRIGLTLRR